MVVLSRIIEMSDHRPWEGLTEVADRETGTIKRYNSGKGYGFIARESGEDLFVHFTALGTADEIKEGQRVEFDVDESGNPMARDVRLL